MQFTLRSRNAKHGLITIEAPDEETARHLAMNSFYGPARKHDKVNPDGRPWTGRGLLLVSVEP
jgi:hypothetical protein